MNDNTSASQKAYLAALQRQKHWVTFFQWACLGLFLLLWEVCAALGVIDPFLFSSPSRMVRSCVELLSGGELFYHIGITVFETVLGFTLGTILGVGIAILLWWNPFLHRVAQPYLVILNSLPKAALAPIFIVWIDNNMGSILAVAILTSVIVTILNVLNGFLSVDPEKQKLIATFGGTKRQLFFAVILPSAVPDIMNALKINVGLSFVGVMVGEFLVSKAGLGYLITYGSQVFKLDWVMLSVVILALLSAFLYRAILYLEKAVLRWRE